MNQGFKKVLFLVEDTIAIVSQLNIVTVIAILLPSSRRG